MSGHCRDCEHARVTGFLKVNKDDFMKSGFRFYVGNKNLKIRCRMGLWSKASGNEKIYRTLSSVLNLKRNENRPCPMFSSMNKE